MPSITFKAFPPALHRALKARAALHRRSLNKEVIAILDQAMTPYQKVDIEAMLAEEKRFRDSLKFMITTEEINAFKREGRL